jgi:hypothetical protein
MWLLHRWASNHHRYPRTYLLHSNQQLKVLEGRKRGLLLKIMLILSSNNSREWWWALMRNHSNSIKEYFQTCLLQQLLKSNKHHSNNIGKICLPWTQKDRNSLDQKIVDLPQISQWQSRSAIASSNSPCLQAVKILNLAISSWSQETLQYKAVIYLRIIYLIILIPQTLTTSTALPKLMRQFCRREIDLLSL